MPAGPHRAWRMPLRTCGRKRKLPQGPAASVACTQAMQSAIAEEAHESAVFPPPSRRTSSSLKKPKLTAATWAVVGFLLCSDDCIVAPPPAAYQSKRVGGGLQGRRGGRRGRSGNGCGGWQQVAAGRRPPRGWLPPSGLSEALQHAVAARRAQPARCNAGGAPASLHTAGGWLPASPRRSWSSGNMRNCPAVTVARPHACARNTWRC